MINGERRRNVRFKISYGVKYNCTVYINWHNIIELSLDKLNDEIMAF